MKTTENNMRLIAKCGLYCGSCGKYTSGKCPGCAENSKATWCKIRSCNLENGYNSCADCKEFANPMDCKKFNNFVSKFFAFVFKSDRPACIAMIKEKGYDNFAAYMSENGWQTIKRA
jgi:hypothetical protein